MADSAPLQLTFYADAEALALAVDANKEIATSPWPGTVQSVTVIPVAAIAGTNLPNSRHWNLYNRTKAAVIATVQLATGTNPAQGVAFNVPITGNAAVALGDVLEFQSVHDGTGLVDPGEQVQVVLARGEVSS
jgi:hypothetical protein